MKLNKIQIKQIPAKLSNIIVKFLKKYGQRVFQPTLCDHLYVFTYPLKFTYVCVSGGLQERECAQQVGADSRVRIVYTRMYARTRETGGVSIYNGDIIADYLRFRVDSRKFSQQKGADRFEVLYKISIEIPFSPRSSLPLRLLLFLFF